MGNLTLILFNAPPVFLGVYHPIAKEDNRRLDPSAAKRNRFFFFLLQVFLIHRRTVQFVHLNCQFGH